MQSRVAYIATGKTGQIYRALMADWGAELGALGLALPPHEFIKRGYSMYLEKNGSDPASNGRIFEFLVGETLLQREIEPFYYQARIRHVPNAVFDIVCYHPTRPVVLSCKVSLRERYKQADSEAMVLQQVYRGAKSYLLTLESQEAQTLQTKINRNEIVGLSACILANTEMYTELLDNLSQAVFCEAKLEMPLSGRLVQTEPS